MGSRQERGRRVIHTPDEIAGIRVATAVTAGVMDEIIRIAQPGISTLALDQMAGEIIRQRGGQSAFLNYRGYGRQICISVNDEVVHGMGRADRIIRPGDLVSFDVGVRLNGFVGDMARTLCVGQAPAGVAAKLMEATEAALGAGIAAARAGKDVCEIGKAVEKVVRRAGFSVVRDFVGHGCGCELHEPPEVPNFTLPPRGPVLAPGMVLAIEPMVNAGTFRVVTDPDGWTVRTADGSLSAHAEHMVLITDREAEIITCPKTPSESRA